jgi:hypothetical protein
VRYYISPPEATDWGLPLEEFAARLRSQWPAATVELLANPRLNYPLEWRIEADHGQLEGSMDRPGQAVTLEGDPRDCAGFALWFRGQAPAEQPLVFYDEQYSASVPLTAATREADIIGAFGTA